MAIALSQSGVTPEIASVLAAMRRTGARTLAVTNDPDSMLAEVAELVYPLARLRVRGGAGGRVEADGERRHPRAGVLRGRPSARPNCEHRFRQRPTGHRLRRARVFRSGGSHAWAASRGAMASGCSPMAGVDPPLPSGCTERRQHDSRDDPGTAASPRAGAGARNESRRSDRPDQDHSDALASAQRRRSGARCRVSSERRPRRSRCRLSPPAVAWGCGFDGEMASLDRGHALREVAVADDPGELLLGGSIPAAVHRLRMSPYLGGRPSRTSCGSWKHICVVQGTRCEEPKSRPSTPVGVSEDVVGPPVIAAIIYV